MTLQSPTRAVFYYGWWILAAGAVMEMLALGSTSYAAGFFVQPLEEEFGFSRAAASSSVSISFIGAALTAPLVGYLLDRFSVRAVLACGGISLGVGFVVISMTSFVPLMVVSLLTFVAFGGMAVGPLTTSTLTSRWFYRRRGRALGVATVATSGGGIFVAPLLAQAIAAYGWRNALVIEAVFIVAIILPLVTFVIRSWPSEIGLEGHFENAGRPATDVVSLNESTVGGAVRHQYGTILKSMEFWAVAFVIASISGINQAIVATIVPYGAQLGFAGPVAAYLVTAFAVCAGLAKVTSGLFSEFIRPWTIMSIGAISMMASLAVFLLLTDYASLLLGCGLAGIGLGCVLPTSAAQIAASFGSPSFGRVMGLIYIAIVLSSVVSVYFAGAAYDRSGDYDAAFLTFFAVAGLALLATFCVRDARQE